MSSANSRNTGVVLAETLTPCGVHPQGHSSFDSRMLTLLGPSGCSGSDTSPPSRSAQLSQGSSAINSPGSVQSTPRQRDPGDVGAPRWRRAGGPDAAEGQSRLPRGGAIPAEPGNKRPSWRDYPGQPGSAVGSAWGSLADGPLLSSRCRRSLVCWNPHLCCLLPPPSAHPPSKALRRRGLFQPGKSVRKTSHETRGKAPGTSFRGGPGHVPLRPSVDGHGLYVPSLTV